MTLSSPGRAAQAVLQTFLKFDTENATGLILTSPYAPETIQVFSHFTVQIFALAKTRRQRSHRLFFAGFSFPFVAERWIRFAITTVRILWANMEKQDTF